MSRLLPAVGVASRISVATASLLAIAWLASPWWLVSMPMGKHLQFVLYRGCALLQWNLSPDPADKWQMPPAFGRMPHALTLWPWRFDFENCTIVLPLWVAVAAVVAPVFIVWSIRGHRRALGHCARCNYDLAGLPARARCPECGAERMPLLAQDSPHCFPLI